MRTRKCSVIGCNNKREDAPLHYFPVRDEQRLTKWLDCINCEALKNCSRKKLGQKVVCHIHFEKRFIKPNSRLRYGAYPSLFTPEEISSGLPNVPIEESLNVNEQPTRQKHSDHTYFKRDARVTASVSACSEAAHSMMTETQTSVVQASTSSQAEVSVSACSAAADSLMTSSIEMQTSFVQASTSSQAEASVSACSETAHSLMTETLTSFVQPSTSAPAEASASACSDVPYSLMTEMKTLCVQASTGASAEVSVSACSEAAHSLMTETQTSVVQASTSSQTEVNVNEQPTRQKHSDHTYFKRDARVTASVSACSEAAHSLMTETQTSFVQPSTSSQAEGARLVGVKTPKASRKRLISKISNLTPKCAKLYKEYSKAKDQVNFLKRAKRALKFSKKNSFDEITKNLNPYAKKFMQMQIRLCTKKKPARRFSDSEKLIALSVMKQSPKCYRFLQRIFILPSKSTLNKLTSQLNIEVGINPVLIEVMKNEITSWENNKKFCSITFDEMHLNEGLNFNGKKDEIDGFEHLNQKNKEFADQALVFMLRGAIWKWQQPFAFYFSKGTTSPAALKTLLKKVVAATIEIGLRPVATICDQGTTFRRALQELQEETRREQILADLHTDETVAICGINLSVVYDPSHLIKGLRNNFLNKTLELDGKISKWQDIVDVYLTDCNHAESRLLHKLNDQHVIPEKINNRTKMKVKAAARVFSSTVSAALLYTAQFSHYADGRPVSETMKNTAETVKFFDELFDSMNGASLHHKHTKGKDLRKAVTASSKHHSFWREAIQKLEKIKFRDFKGKTVSVPTLKSCITTLKSYMRLWQFFQEQGFKVMRPRYFNSDPIENFFGQVRAYNFRNNDPDCHGFTCTFKSLLVTRLITFHNETFNCEDDQADQLLNLAQILKLMSRPTIESHHDGNQMVQFVARQPDHSLDGSVNETVNEARRQRLQVHSRTYTAGWVVRKVLKRTPCDQCKKKLITKTELPIHNWVSHREYTNFKKRLSYPSEQAVRCFGTVMEETNIYLEQNPHVNIISKKIVNSIKLKYEFDINCPEHRDDHFLLLVTRFAIHNWCNVINKILKGTDIVRLERREAALPEIQKKALDNYKKKLKK